MPNISQDTANQLIAMSIFLSGMSLFYLQFDKQLTREKQMRDKRYQLTATLGVKFATHTIWAQNDVDAIGVGAIKVLSLAYKNEVWSDGEIKLISPSGEILQTMKAKR